MKYSISASNHIYLQCLALFPCTCNGNHLPLQCKREIPLSLQCKREIPFFAC